MHPSLKNPSSTKQLLKEDLWIQLERKAKTQTLLWES